MSVAVKERPILFSGPMVRAILDGRKTQTRRVMKPQPSHDSELQVGFFEPTNTDRNGMQYPGKSVFGCWNDEDGWKCPFGSPGDRLWVRETWTPDHKDFYPHFPVCYQADFGPEYERKHGKVWSSEQNAWFPWRWRPSIHMPRWASRITLEITGVRVERLNDISEEDAIAEGMDWHRGPLRVGHTNPLSAFQSLWESINGDGSWALNPFVWAIEFKRV